MNDLLKNKYPYLNKAHDVLQDRHSHERETALWNSFRSGNRDSLNTIFDKYIRLLFAYGKNLTRDGELIADCIQDVFFELWVKRESLTPHPNSVKYYLFSSVRRRIMRRLSAERRFERGAIPDDYFEETELNIEFSFVSEQASHELGHQLKTSIQTLSIAQREAIYLKFYENMSYEEIAVVMNTNVKAVYNLVGRSISSLRQFFKTHPIATQ